MKKSSLAVQAFASAVGAFAYIALVSWIMINGEKFFGGGPRDFRGPLLFLTLFVFSALVTGLTVLGRPAYLLFNGSKKEAVQLLAYTTGFLFIFLVLAFLFFVS